MPDTNIDLRVVYSPDLIERILGDSFFDTISKFCMHCGSFILDGELRKWHIENEHAHLKDLDAQYCLICGDKIGPVPGKRLAHYSAKHNTFEEMVSNEG